MTDSSLVVVGAGPAGMTAALYARRQLFDVTLLEREATGGQMLLAPDVRNYPGVDPVPGYELADRMSEQVTKLGVEVRSGALSCVQVRDDGHVYCGLADGSSVCPQAIVLATGSSHRRAGFLNELRFTGRGVSYCATCDAPFYRNKHVFVIGGGDSAAVEALHLARIASSVTIVVRRDRLAANMSYQRALANEDNIKVICQTVVEAVDGSERVSVVRLRNLVSDSLEVADFGEDGCGVFVAVGRKPSTEALAGLGILDDDGYVAADDAMATTIPGIFAAGDVRRKSLRQIVTACSDGAIAAESACDYLRSLGGS